MNSSTFVMQLFASHSGSNTGSEGEQVKRILCNIILTIGPGPIVKISVSTTLLHPRQPRKGAQCAMYRNCPLSYPG